MYCLGAKARQCNLGRKKAYLLHNMSFAVIKTGGKQYKVAVGDTITIEKIPGEFKVGDKIIFDQVLLVDNGKDTSIGTPFIKDAKVESDFISAGTNKKVIVLRFKQKSRYLKKNGHKQPNVKVKITAIK